MWSPFAFTLSKASVDAMHKLSNRNIICRDEACLVLISREGYRGQGMPCPYKKRCEPAFAPRPWERGG